MTAARSGFRLPAYSEADLEAIESAIVGLGKALQARTPKCGAAGMTCGGVCRRPAGHEPPCFCESIDEDGEETCPG